MAFGQTGSRRSRLSEQRYENSSVWNGSIRSSVNNFSINLPNNKKNLNQIEKQYLLRQRNKIGVCLCKYLKHIESNYKLLHQVCQQLGWKQDSKWQIKWTDKAITKNQLIRLGALQRINHFLGTSIFSTLNLFTQALDKIKQHFPTDYQFFPRYYILPQEQQRIKKYYNQAYRRGLLKTFIVKNSEDIFLTQNIEELPQKCQVQKYIGNPLLFEQRKFDIQTYALIASIQPLRIYIYEEGLVRLSEKRYEFPTRHNIDDLKIHLTNQIQQQSLILPMASFFKKLKQKGHPAALIWSQIKDIIVKSIIAGVSRLIESYRAARPSQASYNFCFQLLSFKFLVDNQSRCFLIDIDQVNNWQSNSSFDLMLKQNMLKDTLLMMSYSQEQLILREKWLTKLDRAKRQFSREKKQYKDYELLQQIEVSRVHNENINRGIFSLIYPSNKERKQIKYQMLLNFTTMNQAKFVFNQRGSSGLKIIKQVIKGKKQLGLKELSKGFSSKNIKKMILKQQTPVRNNLIYNYNIKPALNYNIRSKVVLFEQKQSKGRTLSIGKRIKSQTALSYAKQAPRITTQPIEENQLSDFRSKIRSYKTPLMF